ncbi:MAG: hypothetical protein GY708_07315, partial [Actinomycetia bacterium]|nr:hypothetical protein [Actinomycetes bacterium]
MHDDLSYFIHPLGTYSSRCSLRMAAFEREFLRGQFPGADDGPMYEYEVIRHHQATVDGDPESPKLPGGGWLTDNDLQSWGPDREAYRWTMLHTNNRDTDDYDQIIAVQGLFGQPAATFAQGAQALLDMEQWSRTLAFMSLVGPGDGALTGGGGIHNFRLYVRPDDGRTLFMPWDWDSAFQRPTNASLFGVGNIFKAATATPDFRRRYLAHMCDLCDSVFNTAYMSRWTTHYGDVADEDFGGRLSYIGQRRDTVMAQLPLATTFTASAGTPDANGAVVLSGTAAMKVVGIVVN